MSDTVWLAIIGIVGLVVKDWLDGRRAKRAEDAAKIALEESKRSASVAEIAGIHRDAKIEVIHKATNSLVDKLVESEKSASFAAGKREGEDGR